MRDRAPSIGLRPGLIAATAILLAANPGLHAQGRPAEVRALWVVRATLSSPGSIATMVGAAKDSGFNTLLVQVATRQGSSAAGAAAGFDPIREVIERAHDAGLRVHAWIDVTRAASAVELPLSRDHLVYRHPEWLMVPRALAEDLLKIEPKSPEFLGRLARYARTQPDADALYLSPTAPGAVDYAADAVGDLVARYPVDGVHFDAAGYPRSDFDYGRDALGAFRRSLAQSLSPADQAKYDRRLALEPLIYPEAFPDHWQTFRTNQLTGLMAKLRETVRAARPGAVVSATVQADAEQAANSRFQDWRSWIGRDLIDVVCPIASTADPSAFAAEIASVRQFAGGHPTWAGIGASALSEQDIVASVQAARRLGAGGVIFFSYDGLTGPSRGTEYLSQVGRAAFMQ
jgi:uncharacterized lipoprotein YddW (UPF0748 family)